MRRHLGWILVNSLVVLGLSACASAVNVASPTATPTPSLSAREIALRSAERMLETQSLHFNIQLTGSLAYIDSPPTTAFKSVDGDLVRPGKLRGIVKLSSFGAVTELGLIRYEQDSYVTNPLNQRWEPLPPEWGWYIDPAILFDPATGVPAVLPTLDLSKAGVESIDDRPHYHLHTEAEGDYLVWWTLGLIPEGRARVDVWIDAQTFVLRRAELTELGRNPDDPTVWHIDLSDYDQPVEIQAPPLD